MLSLHRSVNDKWVFHEKMTFNHEKYLRKYEKCFDLTITGNEYMFLFDKIQSIHSFSTYIKKCLSLIIYIDMLDLKKCPNDAFFETKFCL
jgi:hypothetical protein